MLVYKTYKISVSFSDEEEKRKTELLQTYWYKLVNACIKLTVKLGKIGQLDMQYEYYSKLRKLTKCKWNLYSRHLPSVFKVSSEMVRSCIEACKTNCRTRFPTVPKNIPVTLTSNTVKFSVVNDDVYAFVSYQPHNPIRMKLNFPKNVDYYNELKLALQNKVFRIKGVKLLNRDGQWYLYISVEKEVFIPRWEDCETLIGVDVGMNYLVAMTAVSRDTKTIYQTSYVKGKLWKHLQMCKRNKIRKLQSRGANTKEIYDYYNEKFKEILNVTANKVIQYAKLFPKPLIVMGNLKGLKSHSYSKRFNFLLSNWQRNRLEKLIEYKANWNGIPVKYVYEYNTSTTCHIYGNKGRREGTLFYCPICNRIFNSDSNASINIALRGATSPMKKQSDDRRRTTELISSVGAGSPTLQTVLYPTGDTRCN